MTASRESPSETASRGKKTKRYRAKMKASGRCPHCGEPCAPYYECAERRAYKNAQRRARLRGLGPIVLRHGNWVAVNSNEIIAPYTSRSADVRRAPRRGHPRQRPTALKPWYQMTEDELQLEITGLLYKNPLRCDEIEQILNVKFHLHAQRQVDADPAATAEERLFVRHLVRETLPACVELLHRNGLGVAQIVAKIHAPYSTVRYYWLKCEHQVRTRPHRPWIWGIDEQGKPIRVRRCTQQEANSSTPGPNKNP